MRQNLDDKRKNQNMTVFDFVLSAIPVALVLSILLLFIIGIYWREDSKTLAKEASHLLRDHQYQIQQETLNLSQFIESRSAQPYTEYFESGDQSLGDAAVQLKKNYQLYADIRSRIQSQLQKSPKNLIAGPYLWFETRRILYRFRHETEKTALNITAARQSVTKLKLCESRTITTAQQLWIEFENLSELIQTLSHQIHGDQFNQILNDFESIRTELISIPAHLLETDANKTELKGIQQSDIIKTHEILNRQGPPLRALIHTCENWETQIHLIEAELEKLNEKQKNLAPEIGKLPIGINSSQLLTSLNELKSQIRSIRERSRHSEADQLRHFLREIRQTDRLLDGLALEISTTHHNYNIYIELKKTLNFTWQQIRNLAYQLHQSPFLPISFIDSNRKLNQIGTEFNLLTENGNPPTPEKINADSQRMQSLLTECEEQLPVLQAIQSAHTELIALLRKLTNKDMERWIAEMKQILSETNRIPPQNYHFLPAVKGVDLSELLTQIQQTAGEKLPTLNSPIREDTLFAVLAEAKKIDDLRNLVDDALHSQSEQYQRLLEIEESSVEKILAIQTSLERIGVIVFADPKLNHQANQTIQQTRKQHKQLQQQLDNTAIGTIEDKNKDINDLHQSLATIVEKWITELSRTNQQAMMELQNSFDEIRTYANIADPEINQIELFMQKNSTLLQSEEPLDELELLALVGSLEDKTEIQVSIIENQKTLIEVLEQVTSADHNIQKKSQLCQKIIGEAGQWITPDGWSQRALNFDRIRKDFEALQDSIHRFSIEASSIKRYLAQTERYLQQLAEIEGRCEILIEEASKENELIANAESAFEITGALWNQLAAQHQDDRTLVPEIRSMIQEYNQKLKQQQQRFNRGDLKVADYVSIVKRIDRDLNNETIETSSGQFINVNGHEFS